MSVMKKSGGELAPNLRRSRWEKTSDSSSPIQKTRVSRFDLDYNPSKSIANAKKGSEEEPPREAPPAAIKDSGSPAKPSSFALGSAPKTPETLGNSAITSTITNATTRPWSIIDSIGSLVSHTIALDDGSVRTYYSLPPPNPSSSFPSKSFDGKSEWPPLEGERKYGFEAQCSSYGGSVSNGRYGVPPLDSKPPSSSASLLLSKPFDGKPELLPPLEGERKYGFEAEHSSYELGGGSFRNGRYGVTPVDCKVPLTSSLSFLKSFDGKPELPPLEEERKYGLGVEHSSYGGSVSSGRYGARPLDFKVPSTSSFPPHGDEAPPDFNTLLLGRDQFASSYTRDMARRELLDREAAQFGSLPFLERTKELSYHGREGERPLDRNNRCGVGSLDSSSLACFSERSLERIEAEPRGLSGHEWRFSHENCEPSYHERGILKRKFESPLDSYLEEREERERERERERRRILNEPDTKLRGMHETDRMNCYDEIALQSEVRLPFRYSTKQVSNTEREDQESQYNGHFDHRHPDGSHGSLLLNRDVLLPSKSFGREMDIRRQKITQKNFHGAFLPEDEFPLLIFPEGSEEFKQQVQKAYFKYSKILNETSDHKKLYQQQQGKARNILCLVCGRNSKGFKDTHYLIMHVHMSQKRELRAEHLGFYKAICTLMGWSLSKEPANSKSYQQATLEEVESDKEDLILWPPCVVIHNTHYALANYPRHSEDLLEEEKGELLKELGYDDCKGKVVCKGHEPTHRTVVIKYVASLLGLEEAELLHQNFKSCSHGRKEWLQICPKLEPVAKDDAGGPEFVQMNEKTKEKKRVLYGYLAVASDLDKVDFETKQHCVVKSLKEIKVIANISLN